MPPNMIVCASKCEGNRISLWFSNVHHLEIMQNQFLMIPSLAKPHMRRGFCSLVLSLIMASPVIHIITKYGSTLYIGMDKVFQHHAHTFEKSNLNFHFQCEFSSVAAEW